MNKTMEPKLGAPQTCPECKTENPSGLNLPKECIWCGEFGGRRKNEPNWEDTAAVIPKRVGTRKVHITKRSKIGPLPETKILSDEPFDRELWLKRWDTWREYVENGGGGSWPRDAFESLLDYVEELQKELNK